MAFNVISVTNQKYTNSEDNVTLKGTNVSDTINNEGSEVVIDAGSGNDVIDNFGGSGSVSISGGSGNDLISNSASDVTVNGGKGNDTINLNGETYIKYAAGDGNDVVVNYDQYSTFVITDGTYTTSTNGSDGVFHIGNGSVTFKNVAGKSVNFIDQNGSFMSAYFPTYTTNDTIPGPNPPDEPIVIDLRNTSSAQNISEDTDDNVYVYFNDVGDNSAEITEDATGDKIIQAGDGGDYLTNYSTSANVTLNGGEGPDVITNSGGKYGAYVVIEGSGGDDTINIEGGNALIKYSEGDGNDVIVGYSSNNTIQIARGEYSTSYSGNDVILTIADRKKESTLKLVGMLNKPINIVNEYGQNETITVGPQTNYVWNNEGTSATLNANFTGTFDLSDDDTLGLYPNAKTVDGGQATGSVSIIGNSKANVLNGGKLHDYINGGPGADSIKGNAGDDTIDGGIGNDTVYGGVGRDVFVYNAGEGNDIIMDYTSGKDSLAVYNASVKLSSVSGDDVILGVGTNFLTLKGAKGNEVTIVNEDDEVYTTRFTDEIVVNDEDSSKVTMDSIFKVVNATARTKAIEIVGNTGANTLLGGTKADTIRGGAGKDYIEGGAGKDYLFGDGGADTLYGGAGNDQLTGGKGKDVFVVVSGGGNDTIMDYAQGDDTIKLYSGKLTAIQAVEAVEDTKDAVLKFKSGSVTLKDAKGLELTIVDASGNSTVTIAGDSIATAVAYDDDSSVAAQLDQDIVFADATERTKSIRIKGNILPNTILGGSGSNTINGAQGDDYIEGGKSADSLVGGVGDDSLIGNAGADTLTGGAGNDYIDGGKGKDVITGGKGNDTLKGGAGANTYVYANGDGDDLITDFKSSDQIRITDGAYSVVRSGRDIVVKVGNGSMTLQNAYGITPRIITGAEYEERWFMEGDDNFVTGDSTDVAAISDTSSNALTNEFNYDVTSALNLTKDNQVASFNYNKKSEK